MEYFSWSDSFGMIENQYVTHSKSPILALSFSLSQMEAKATIDVEIIFFKFFLTVVKITRCTGRNNLSLSELGLCLVWFMCTKMIAFLAFPPSSMFSFIIYSIIFNQKEQLYNLDFLSCLLFLFSRDLISFLFMTAMLVFIPMRAVVHNYMTFPSIRRNKYPL